MFKKSFVALATLLCGAAVFAAPGAYTQWFANAVTDPLTKGTTGWSDSAVLADGAVAVTTDAAVSYTAKAPATAYAKQTVTITSEPLDELPLPTGENGDPLAGARFAFGVAQLEGDANPAVYVLSKVDDVAKWTKTSISATAGATTAVEVTYDKVAKTFTVTDDPTVFTSLIDESTDWTKTSFVGNGEVNALVGEKAGVGVAMINGVGYDTIESAIAAAGANTIDLTANVTLPASAANYKINTNGFTVDTPEGYITSVNGSTVAVTAASGAAVSPASMIWNRDFRHGRVDNNRCGWSGYVSGSGAKASETGVTIGTGGGYAFLARTKDATLPEATQFSAIFRAKGIVAPASGYSALFRAKNGNAIGVAITSDGKYQGIAGENLYDTASGTFYPQAAEVERTFVLTYGYNDGGTKLYELIGDRTVALLYAHGTLRYSGLNKFNELELLGMWNSSSCNGATLTGLAIFEGQLIDANTTANFDWTAPDPEAATNEPLAASYIHYNYIPASKATIWPGLTLDDIKTYTFSAVMNGGWVKATGNAWDTFNCEGAVPSVTKTVNADSIVLLFKKEDQSKYVKVTLTDGVNGIEAVGSAGAAEAATGTNLAQDDFDNGYGINCLTATMDPAARVGDKDYPTFETAFAAARANPATVVEFIKTFEGDLPEDFVMGENQAWVKRTVYMVSNDSTTVKLADHTQVTVRDGDVVHMASGYYTKGQWGGGQDISTFKDYPVVIDLRRDLGAGVGIAAGQHLTISSGVDVSLYGNIGEGATIDGAGMLYLAYGNPTTTTINGGVTIYCTTGFGSDRSNNTIVINGNVTFSGTVSEGVSGNQIKLNTDAATLKVATKLTDGIVTCNSGRFVKFDEETKTYSSAHLAATIGDDNYETLKDALDAVTEIQVVTIVDGTTELPDGYEATCVISGTQAWKKRTVYVMSDGQTFKLDAETAVTPREGDTITYAETFDPGNRWQVTLPTTTYPIVVNWQGDDPGISVWGVPAGDQVEIKSGSKMYIQGAYGDVDLNNGAVISGAGSFVLNDASAKVMGTVVITATISAGSGKLKLTDGATLKTATAIPTIVTTEVSGKRVATATEGEYTVYTLEAIPPAPAGEITVAQGANPQQVVVTVPVANAEGATVTVTVDEHNYQGTVSGGSAVVTIAGDAGANVLEANTAYEYTVTIQGVAESITGSFATGFDNVWFAASAATGESVVKNGAWQGGAPEIADSNYVINSAEGNTFSVTDGDDGDGKLAVLTHVVTFTSAIDPLDLPTVNENTLGAITVAEVEGVNTWMGVVDGKWTALTGTPVLDAEVTVTVEYDRRGTGGVFTYKVGGVTLGVNAIEKTTGFNGVTAVGSGKLKSLEATIGEAQEVIDDKYTATDLSKPLVIDAAFARELGAKKAEIQTALNTATGSGLKGYEAYVLGVPAEKLDEPLLISGVQDSATTTMTLTDGFTKRTDAGVTVTRTVKTKATADAAWSTDEAATQNADGVTIALPTGADKAKYIKIEYTFE